MILGDCWASAICGWRTRWARLWGGGARQSGVVLAWKACLYVERLNLFFIKKNFEKWMRVYMIGI